MNLKLKEMKIEGKKGKKRSKSEVKTGADEDGKIETESN